jgi:mannose-6-phosphate isomerase-like protein (cupin superfamily)
MIELISQPTVLQAAGTPPKTISEFVGRLTTGSASVSVAIMDSPSGWAEPGQRPDFDEYTVVLAGEVRIDTEDGSITVAAGQAARAPAGAWVQYSTPGPSGARYVAVCTPAFSPDAVNRDDESGPTASARA